MSKWFVALVDLLFLVVLSTLCEKVPVSGQPYMTAFIVTGVVRTLVTFFAHDVMQKPRRERPLATWFVHVPSVVLWWLMGAIFWNVPELPYYQVWAVLSWAMGTAASCFWLLGITAHFTTLHGWDGQ